MPDDKVVYTVPDDKAVYTMPDDKAVYTVPDDKVTWQGKLGCLPRIPGPRAGPISHSLVMSSLPVGQCI